MRQSRVYSYHAKRNSYRENTREIANHYLVRIVVHLKGRGQNQDTYGVLESGLRPVFQCGSLVRLEKQLCYNSLALVNTTRQSCRAKCSKNHREKTVFSCFMLPIGEIMK